ncbi:uncharacterized protein LOC130015409 [Mercurialis annua]|uniref:uncharacterized protein LOC130015409 n=1 Tax=Mercurialis annua TaxID=3986 RepID=UPI0024AFD16B|nr:uncharacterized protein LOC130015409 [Mercurialis annua]
MAEVLGTYHRLEKQLFVMHNGKSTGSGGFNPGFFKSYLGVVGDDVIKLCKEFFANGFFKEGLNDTALVLIPKSAFVENRLITDNIFIAYEIGHYLRGKRREKLGMVALKIDINKTYDRVKWEFKELMLRRLGFYDEWIKLIIYCLSLVKCTSIGDCTSMEPIIPSREVLRLLLTHVLRMIVSIFLCFVGEMTVVKSVLNEYERMSGQKVNVQKSNITFNPNVTMVDKLAVNLVMGMEEVSNSGKYLGLPFCEEVERMINSFWSGRDLVKNKDISWTK